jgi:uncharacterized membrane protein
MSYAYGYNDGEHYTTAIPKQQAAQQAAMANAYAQQNYDRQGEDLQRGILQQEQQRRAYDSETARRAQDQKNQMMGGILSGLMGGGRLGGGFGGGFGSFQTRSYGGRPGSGPYG